MTDDELRSALSTKVADSDFVEFLIKNRPRPKIADRIERILAEQ